MATTRVHAEPYTGDPNGPKLSHLRVKFANLKRELMLKPNADKLNENDFFFLLIGLTAGDAHDQACALMEELEEELANKNAAAKIQFEQQETRGSTTRPRTRQATATDPEGSITTQSDEGTARFVEETLFDDPIGRFWKRMEELYPEKSVVRINEFRVFALKPNETMSSAVSRMMSLCWLLKQPEPLAVTRFLQAIRPRKLQEEVRRQLLMTVTDAESWTLQQVGEIATRLERAHSFESLWTASITRPEASSSGAPSAAPSRPRSDDAGGLTIPFTCHTCGQEGHKSPQCPERRRTKAPPAAMRAAPPHGPAQDARSCYICGQTGHFAAKCPNKEAHNKSGEKMWCSLHQVGSHTNAACRSQQRAAQRGRHPAHTASPSQAAPKPPVAARAAQPMAEAAHDDSALSPHTSGGRAPTHEQLLSLWETTYGTREVPDDTAASGFRGQIATTSEALPAPQKVQDAAPTTEGLRKRAPTNERVRGRQIDMPLSFLPRDLLKPLAARHDNDQAPDTEPEFAAPQPVPALTKDVPASFEELPRSDPEWQGEELYNVNNPRLAAMLSSLPGSFHSDPSEGFYRSPKIDNAQDRPALLINGNRVHNVILDLGAEAVITGPNGAAAMGITPDMITRDVVPLKIADGQITKKLDRTTEPLSFVFNPDTPDELTVHSYVLIVPHELPETLLGMSVMGPAGLVSDVRKQRVYYYRTDAQGREVTCTVASRFPIEYGPSPLSGARHAEVRAFSGFVPAAPGPTRSHLASYPWVRQPCVGLGKITTEQVQIARRRIEQARTERRLTNLDIYDRTFKVVANLQGWKPPISMPAYVHLKPLNWDYVDKHRELSPNNPEGVVVLELFAGIMATTEALLRNGIKIRRVYACEVDPKARDVAEFRLRALSLTFPELLAPEAWAECFTALPQDIRRITKEHLEQLTPVDLIVAGFPCQGFSQASSHPEGLRDKRSRLLFDAVTIVHDAFELWGPTGYLFENVDASDHRIPAVRDEFNQVVKGLLGRPCTFDAVAVGSYAHRNRCWWTNLIPGPLLHTMVERAFQKRDPFQQASQCLDRGRKVGHAHNSRAPGRHSVNIPGAPLKAFSTFVSLLGSHSYQPVMLSLLTTLV